MEDWISTKASLLRDASYVREIEDLDKQSTTIARSLAYVSYNQFFPHQKKSNLVNPKTTHTYGRKTTEDHKTPQQKM